MNEAFFQIINELHSSFIKNLNQLKEVLDDLLNLDINITDEQLTELRRKTQDVIVSMKKDCQRLYLNALLTGTTTPEEKQTINELALQNEKIKQLQIDSIEKKQEEANAQKEMEKTLIERIIGNNLGNELENFNKPKLTENLTQ